ncbi:UNVERIFIED_CONTAM: hypothetical protein Scaly_3058200 [Sesamum calycinum]|uniref:Endonuclease/exonuclease/phosphatase domain-containing protein n=1 Tax=Sesamum calycinum TaxID=2727403 RepID=A0AAW2K2B5_9LAMI
MRDFREYLDDYGLQDIGFEGKIFTLWNRREAPHIVRARLDRACNNLKWAEIFPQAIMSHEAVTCSDHWLIWIGLEGERIQDNKRKKRCFRFEAAWLSAPECADVIQRAWTSTYNTEPHQNMIKKLRATRTRLQQRNRENFGNIRRKCKELNEKLCMLQQNDVSAKTKKEIERLKDAIEEMVGKEEILWNQRAKAL